MFRTILILLIAVSLTAGTLFYRSVIKPHQAPLAVKIDGAYLTEATPIVPFHFTDQYDAPFSNDNLKGKWTFLFFGFTNCGYVCPTTLTELNKMYQLLQKELSAEQMPQVVLVSVDPERDTTTRLREYLTAFNPRFTGIRADVAATAAFEEGLHISAIKVAATDQPEDHYMINHTAEILLINPEGKIQAYLSYPHQAAQLVEDYKTIIHGKG